MFFHIQNKAQPYPSEQAKVEQEKLQNQLTAMSMKLNEIENRKEPVYAFRVSSVKNSGTSKQESVYDNPGEMFIIYDILLMHFRLYLFPYKTNNLSSIIFLVIWENTEYNIGNGYNINDGKFTAPIDGIYFFNFQAQAADSYMTYIYFYVNGSDKSTGHKYAPGDKNIVTLSSQFKLNKGDTVWVRLFGQYTNPTYSKSFFFEGHLIRKLNS